MLSDMGVANGKPPILHIAFYSKFHNYTLSFHSAFLPQIIGNCPVLKAPLQLYHSIIGPDTSVQYYYYNHILVVK